MRTIFLSPKLFLLSLLVFIHVSVVFGVGNYTWKSTAANSNWEDPNNWSGTPPVNGSNQVVFTSTDNITISTSSYTPILNSTQTIGTFTVSANGNLKINSGFILNVSGTTSIGDSAIIDGAGQLILGPTATVNASIGGTAGATINCSISGTIGALYLYKSTFNGTTTFKIITSGAYYNIGGNTYNGVTSFESAGTAGVRLSELGEDHFNNDVTLISSSGVLYTSYSYNTTYKGNIVVKSTGAGVYFGNPIANSLITSTLVSGKTITANSFTAGNLTLKNFIQQGSSSSQNITLGGTTSNIVFSSGNGTSPLAVFDAPITVTAPVIVLNGANFKEAVTFNASANANCLGGNIYQKTSSFNFNNTNVNSAWTFGGIDQYLGDATFVNNNVGNIFIGNGTATFAGNATFDNKGVGQILLAYATNSAVNFTNSLAKVKMIVRGTGGSIKMAEGGTTNFDCNVEVNSTGGSNIYSVSTGSGKVYLKEGRNISVGDLGFSFGGLVLRNFIQIGATTQNLSFSCSNNATVYFQGGCDFSGDLTVTAPIIYIQGGTFRGVSDFTICYSTTTTLTSLQYGPVLFKGDVYFRHGSNSHFCLGYGAFEMTFEGNVNFYINSAGSLYLAYVAGNITTFAGTDKKVKVNISSVDNAIRGAIYFVNNGDCQIKSDLEISNNAAASVVIGSSGTGKVTLGEGKIISIPAGAFSFGNLNFKNFEQIGNTPQSLTLSGSAYTAFSDGTIFNGDLTVVSPRFSMTGAKFKGVSYFERTGSVIDLSNGNNEFYKKTTIKNASSNYTIFCNTSTQNDHFYDTAVFWNAASGHIYIAHNGNAQFDGNILFKNTGSGTIYIGNNTGIATLANGKSISAEPFTSSGGLSIRNFKQPDSLAAQNLNLGSTSSASLVFGTGCEFSGPVTVNCNVLYLNGSIFKGKVDFTVTNNNAGNATSAGGNTYLSDFKLTSSGTNGMYLASTNGDIFKGNVIINKSSAGIIQLARSGNSEFYGDVIYNAISGQTPDAIGIAGGTAVFKGNKRQFIKATPSLTFYNIKIDKSSNHVVLNSTISAITSLQFLQGNIVSNSSNLLKIYGATVTGASASSFVDGPVQKIGSTAFIFPVGKKNIYRPIETFNFSGGGASTLIQAEYFDTVASVNNISTTDRSITVGSCEYWSLKNLSTSSLTSQVRVYWPAGPCSSGANPKLMRSTANQWTALATSLNNGVTPKLVYTTNSISIGPNSTGLYGFGFSGFELNTTNVNTAYFDVYQNGTLLLSNKKSGKDADANGKIILEPSIPTSSDVICLKVKESASNDSLKILFNIDPNLAITNVKVKIGSNAAEPMSTDYYSLSTGLYSKGISFKNISEEVSSLDIKTNVVSGKLTGEEFEVEGLKYLSAELKIYTPGILTPIAVLDNTISKADKITWNAIPSEGLYKFILKLTDSSTPSPKVSYYEGQFIK